MSLWKEFTEMFFGMRNTPKAKDTKTQKAKDSKVDYSKIHPYDKKDVVKSQKTTETVKFQDFTDKAMQSFAIIKKAKKQIDVYVPVKVGKILCHSKLLDDIGEFTQYMIWAIGSGYSEQQIKDTIQLDDSIVEEELQNFKQWKFAEYKGKWELTPCGREYFELICCMEKLKNKGFPCLVELCNGQVELENGQADIRSGQELTSDAMCLKPEVSEVLLRNDNYENSLDTVKEKLKDEKLLSEAYMDSIYTTLEFSDKEPRYRRYQLPSYNLETKAAGRGKTIQMAIPIAYLRYKKYFVLLDKYRTVLETMKNLRTFEHQMMPGEEKILTKNALTILKGYEKERALEPIGIYIDECLGKVVWESESGGVNKVMKRRTNIGNVLPVTKYQCEFKKNDVWRLELLSRNEEYAYPLKIYFSDLRPVVKKEMHG